MSDLNLDLREGEFFSLLGPSGCGKTTALRMIAGFQEPSAGKVIIDGQDMEGIPANKRPTNMVFQSYAIFPHLNVGNNVAYGLRNRGISKAEIDPGQRGAGNGRAGRAAIARRDRAVRRAAAARGAGPGAGDAAQGAALG